MVANNAGNFLPFPQHLLPFCLRHSPSKAGREVAFLKLARAQRGRWLVLREFAKYAFCGLKRKRRDFERSVLMYVSIKIPALTHSGWKMRVCVNQLNRLLPPNQGTYPLCIFLHAHQVSRRPLQALKGPPFASSAISFQTQCFYTWQKNSKKLPFRQSNYYNVIPFVWLDSTKA
jgi:hypothetical protein